MRRYDLDQRATDDVLDLVEYAQSYSDAARDRLTDALVEAFEHLAEYPYSGRSRSELAPALRSFSVSPLGVTVYYTVAPERNQVRIARILRHERGVGEADFP